MKSRTKAPAIVTKVKQIIETDNVGAANEWLMSGDWILLNSYHNRALSTRPVMRLGRINEYDDEIPSNP
jgi:hypothetical protein